MNLFCCKKKEDEEILCRICHEDKSSGKLISPCKCRGSLQFVHEKCLNEWIKMKDGSRCEICDTSMNTSIIFKKEASIKMKIAFVSLTLLVIICCCLPFFMIIDDAISLSGENLNSEKLNSITLFSSVFIFVFFIFGFITILCVFKTKDF